MGSRKIRAIFVAAFLWLLFPLLEAAQVDAKTKGAVKTSELSMNVLSGYFIVVKVNIGDRYDLNFLLDTGATTSAIDRNLAERLNLPTRSSQMVSFDKTLQVQWCVLPELAYGPGRVTNIKVAVEDLRYLRSSGVAVDGVIGWDLLRRHNFRVDFANKRVVFGTISTTDRHAVPFRDNSLFPSVPIYLDGRELWMIADTGMPSAMFYEPQLEGFSYKWQRSISGQGVGGNLETQIALVPRFRIGAQDLDRQVYVVRPPNSALLDGIAGCLGIASLNAKHVTFDVDRGVLSWQ